MKTQRFAFILAMLILLPQVIAAQLKTGVQAGVNLQNFNGKDQSGDKLEYDLTPGFHAGVSLLMPIAPEIWFQPGLLFSTKGAALKEATPDAKYRVSYIELPLNLLYRGRLGNGFVLLGFGPYVGYAAAGKVIIGDDKSDVHFTNTIESGDPTGNTYLKRFDAGAGIYAGYELANGVFIQLNTQIGLIKINPEDNRISGDETAVKNTGFGLSLGYRF